MILEFEDEARAAVASLCDAPAMDRLSLLIELLREENERQNLVSRASLDSIWLRHIADSAQLIHFAGDVEVGPDSPWLDLGTGAGFPGLVIAAMRPQWPVRLVESRKRRVEWLERAARAMNLSCCEVIGDRLEMVESFPASVISARAFAPMPRLLSLSARFSTRDTLWLLPKGASAKQDLASLSDSQASMFHVEQSWTDPEAGIVIGQLAKHKSRPRVVNQARTGPQKEPNA